MGCMEQRREGEEGQAMEEQGINGGIDAGPNILFKKASGEIKVIDSVGGVVGAI